jgi:hypothetical protein
MAKSRRNVSRRKRQQKRRKSNRRNFRKMSGGGLIDNLDVKEFQTELEKLKSDEITDYIIKNTIEQLNKNDWKKYSPIDTINIEKVKEIIKKLEEKNSNNPNNTANPPSWF